MRRARYSFLAAIIALAFSGPAMAQSFCAEPRETEPLVKEAFALGISKDGISKGRRALWGIPPLGPESIYIVSKNEICRQAARAYRGVLRASDQETYDGRFDDAVLVVRVGPVYLVDDLRARDKHWKVMIFDARWHRIYAFGGGA